MNNEIDQFSGLVSHKKAPENNIEVDRAILVVVESHNDSLIDWEAEELHELAYTAGVEIAGEVYQKRFKPHPAYYIGSGKIDEIFEITRAEEANVVLFGDDLSPTQLRNLENALSTRVIDRTQLILDIFAQRAKTREGKLQVELAQLNYMLPRLTGKGSKLSRLGGGVGTRGPGETKLETDRRRIRKKIEHLKKDLEEIVQHREVQRKGRRKLPFPSAALVGYTSAGKSTLLNALSGSDVLTDGKLFATLDPTTRRVELPSGGGLILTDTVGFIRHLPHHLVMAFRATLEEVRDADFLIHVVDSAHPQRNEQMEAVEEVLDDLDVLDKTIITVFNKSDLFRDQYELRRGVLETPNSVYISALTGDGMPYLMKLLDDIVRSLVRKVTLKIPYSRSDLVSLCYDNGHVLNVEYNPDAIIIEAEIGASAIGKLQPYKVNDQP